MPKHINQLSMDLIKAISLSITLSEFSSYYYFFFKLFFDFLSIRFLFSHFSPISSYFQFCQCEEKSLTETKKERMKKRKEIRNAATKDGVCVCMNSKLEIGSERGSVWNITKQKSISNRKETHLLFMSNDNREEKKKNVKVFVLLFTTKLLLTKQKVAL